jgi:hypothetical protein
VQNDLGGPVAADEDGFGGLPAKSIHETTDPPVWK